MFFPFEIIESKISNRNQFELLDGCQPTHSLFYLKSGCFSIEIDGTEDEIRSGDCIILPDYIHFHRNVINPVEFIYIKFTQTENCPYSFSLPYGKVTFKDKNRFISSITSIEQLITSDTVISANYREHLLMDILFQIHFEQHPADTSPHHTVCHDVLVCSAAGYIREHIREKILIEDLCRFVGTNTSTLNFKFRREFDMSIGQFIASERIKKAKHLLISTTYSISEVARRCGFENVYYFSNAFKKITGISPSAFRQFYR